MSNRETRPTVAENREILRRNVDAEFDFVVAAGTLMELCDSNPEITIDDG